MDIVGETIAIADGRGRQEIEQRARNAFRQVNAIRATSGVAEPDDLADRLEAGQRAATWVQILRHLDRTGSSSFDRGQFGDPRWSLAGTFGFLPMLRVLWGRAPVTFYTPPQDGNVHRQDAPSRAGEAA